MGHLPTVWPGVTTSEIRHRIWRPSGPLAVARETNPEFVQVGHPSGREGLLHRSLGHRSTSSAHPHDLGYHDDEDDDDQPKDRDHQVPSGPGEGSRRLRNIGRHSFRDIKVCCSRHRIAQDGRQVSRRAGPDCRRGRTASCFRRSSRAHPRRVCQPSEPSRSTCSLDHSPPRLPQPWAAPMQLWLPQTRTRLGGLRCGNTDGRQGDHEQDHGSRGASVVPVRCLARSRGLRD